MIEVKNVTKTFGDFKALDGLELTVPKGAVYGLVGPNGAGKTTILKTIAGIYKQTEGEVLINGEKVFENVAVKNKMAFISDDLYFFTAYSILDTAKFYAKTYPLWSWERFESLKEIFKIDVNRKVRRLSKGMQKQVAFWLAVCARPEILLLDEPVDGLDPVMRRQIWTILMSEVEDKKMTVLVSSHNLRELDDVSDHVGIMNKGKVIIERSLSELQGNISKIQVACPVGMPKLPPEYKVLHMSNTGRVYTMIVKGNPKEVVQAILTDQGSPVVVDSLPLTLEEIFIYEMGGEDYEVKDILF